MAGGIAHDFNNILSAIIGYAELARVGIQGNCSDKKCRVSHDIEEVLRGADRAKELVRQILTFSRQQVGEHRPVELDRVVQDALKMLRALIPTTIEIRQRIDVDENMVLADPTQIHQIVMNLGTNAYHAMRETGGVLGVELVKTDIGPNDRKFADLKLAFGPYLVLRVSDTGCGMSRRTMERIFDPYFTTKGEDGGTGLGLSVVHGIVKSHQGHISVYSEVGQGTTFHVYLPRLLPGHKAERGHELSAVVGGHEHLLWSMTRKLSWRLSSVSLRDSVIG